MYQAPGSAAHRPGWWPVVQSGPWGEDSYCEGAERVGSHSATETLLFVYGAQCSYLPPVLTPRSSCFKSLPLVFSSLLPQTPASRVVFMAFLFFSMEIRLSYCGDIKNTEALLVEQHRTTITTIISTVLACFGCF